MNKLLMIGIVTAVVGGASVTARAMPVAPVSSTSSADVTQVAFGCGPYRHPGPRGFCVPNRPAMAFRPYGPRFYGRPYRDRYYGRRYR